MIAPDKTVAWVCSECMDAVFKFFKSGDAEKAVLEGLNEDLRDATIIAANTWLDVDFSSHKLAEFSKQGKLKVFDNVEVREMRRAYGYERSYDYAKYISSRSVPQWYADCAKPAPSVTEIQAIISPFSA